MGRLVWLLAGLLPQVALAQAIDCATFAHGSMPYQLEMKDGSGRTIPFQVYRRGTSYRIEYEPAGNGAKKTVYQGIFPLSTRGPDGTTVMFGWSVPNRGSVFGRGGLNARMATIVGGQITTNAAYRFRFIGTEKIAVGPCVFETKHYSVMNDQTAGPVRTEAWFSPDLRAALETRTTLRRGAKTRVVVLKATGITIAFTPLR